LIEPLDIFTLINPECLSETEIEFNIKWNSTRIKLATHALLLVDQENLIKIQIKSQQISVILVLARQVEA